MKVTTLPSEFKRALPVIEQLNRAGFQAYFVGGSVRDSLLQQEIHDVDIATSAYPAEVKAVFSKTIDLGIEHGTVLVLFEGRSYEITTFRTESSYQDYRRPDTVNFVSSLSEDLKRRDFTINALAMNQEGEIIDLFTGIDDLEKGYIRAVGNPSERFHEDALRMMRALRFASQLDFTIEPNTLQALRAESHLLAHISVERLQVEYLKLCQGKNRQQGLALLCQTGCYQYCPGFKEHKEGLLAFSQQGNHSLENNEAIWVLTVLFLSIPSAKTASFLQAWKCSNKTKDMVVSVQKAWLYLQENPSNKRLLYDLGGEKLQVLQLVLSFFQQENLAESIVDDYQSLPIHSLRDLEVDGKFLLQASERAAGPWVGQVLRQLETAVLQQKVVNRRTDLWKYYQTNLTGGRLDGNENKNVSTD